MDIKLYCSASCVIDNFIKRNINYVAFREYLTVCNKKYIHMALILLTTFIFARVVLFVVYYKSLTINYPAKSSYILGFNITFLTISSFYLRLLLNFYPIQINNMTHTQTLEICSLVTTWLYFVL